MLNDYICFPLFLFRRITLLVAIIFIGIISAARAQQASSEKEIQSGKSAIDIRLSVLPYDAVGTPEYRMPALDVPFIHLSYIQRLSDRANLQIGIGYGMNEAQQAGVSRHIKADSIYMKETYQHLSAVAIPFTFKWTPFNPGKRLQFYGSASFTPLYRHIKARATESLKVDPL
ncbi:hypothetical protein [Pontibacter fetidus]|uniref:Outer membrane protein beta-barrel domain-containing protein n=1 Tax=Pontibacter fetidus TaxID=2700082 RepID=A0A6B2GXQ6_9BACT|nr:hypothetical protein [Pontibacter fetidus]NDK54763.1 hypothetical protein [Pontibacter fetidus]